MSSTKQAFLKAIEEDPRDEVNHAVFADFLEENGEDDEAAIHREFSVLAYDEAMAYLKEWHNRLVTDDGGLDQEEIESYNRDLKDITFERVMEVAEAQLKDGGDRWSDYITLPFDTPGFAYYEKEKFWECFGVVTFRRLSEDQKDRSFVSCSC